MRPKSLTIKYKPKKRFVGGAYHMFKVYDSLRPFEPNKKCTTRKRDVTSYLPDLTPGVTFLAESEIYFKCENQPCRTVPPPKKFIVSYYAIWVHIR